MNIFQAYAQPARSVMDYQADYDAQDMRRVQLGAARRTNEIAGLTAEQTRQTMAESTQERNILRQLASQYGGDEQGFIRALGASGSHGLMKMAGEREKSALDRGKIIVDTAKTDAETKALQAKAKYEAADRLAQKIGMVNTPDDLQAYENEGIDLGIFPAERRGSSLQQAQQMGGIEQWKAASAKAAVSSVDQFKTAAEMARAKLTADTSILTTGMTNATSRDNNAATQATALAGQRSVAATAKAARDQSASQFTARQDSSPAVEVGADPVQTALNKKFGKPEVGRRWKADGSLEPIPGGSADRKTNEQQAGKETVDSVVASLRQSYDALNTGGGITSTEKGAAGNLSAAMSRSSAGQTVGGAFGTRNQKERDAVAQARPLLLQAIMKATGMSAKQMDSNAELKLYLATATDPQLTLEANREALDRIEKLYGSGSTGAAPAKPGKAVKRTGTSNGRKVIEYTDGSIEYAD